MRILWAVSSLLPGGAERVLSELAGACAARGDAVGLLTLSSSDSDHYRLSSDVERIGLDALRDATSLDQRITGNVRRCLQVRDAVRRFRPDIVVSFIDQMNVLLLAALLGTGIPVVVSERVDPRRRAVGRPWNLARRLLYPFADRVVVQTDAVARDWAVHIVSPEKVAVIPNFVRALPAVPPFRERAVDQVLAVGRLDRQKGFDLLLDAFAQSGLPGRGVRLVILGDGPERQALEAQARDLGIEAAVSMPGVVRDPEAWMARCTFFVLSSRYEGYPNALLEAMAMGCPAIAADCDSGPRELIHDGENGLLVPVDDAKALADAMQRLWSDVALRQRLQQAAVAVRQRYTREMAVDQWASLFKGLLDEKGRRSTAAGGGSAL